jgi:hypothetical protein
MDRGVPDELQNLDLYQTWVDSAELGATFDPFRWPQRMAAYRALLEATNQNGRFGPENRGNPLWGLMFQHQWQMRTGRLGARAQHDGSIDPDSAWGYGNYTLSVLPWLGAERAGVVAARTIAGPPTTSRFRYVEDGVVPGELEAGINAWRDYFEQVSGVGVATDGGQRRHQPTPVEEGLRLAMWRAHKVCLDVVAARTATDRPGPLPTCELDFLRGWCRMVDFLWAAAFPTHFDFTVAHGLDLLPERMLTHPEVVEQLPEREAGTTANVLGLARASPARARVSLWLWRRAMRTAPARADVLPLLDAAFHRRRDNATTRARLLWLIVAPRSRAASRRATLSPGRAAARAAVPPGRSTPG